tara:strand:- start:3989 stop:4534 length:546 start_codon:yes stop_codon:yes gene_type:complete
MRKIYFLFIIFLFSCSNTGKRVYICGDHPCKDKKEIEEYFKDNISIEVYVIESEKKKNKNRDLVELNIIKDKDYDQNKDKEFDFLRNRKDQKKLINKGEKPEKLKLKVTNTEKKKDQITKKSDDGKIDIKSKDKTFSYKRKSTKIVHLCRKIDECDINLISKKIYDLGKEKSYPDITNSKQ